MSSPVIDPKKKQIISGTIQPRWPKDRVVHWLELGAIPAVVGLWFPDWIGAYLPLAAWHIPPRLGAFPPLLAYAGVLVLLKACYEGIRDMGWHFRGVQISGGLALVFAVVSVIAQLAGFFPWAIAAAGGAAFFAAGFFWFTTGKIAQITQETRTAVTFQAEWALAVVSVVVFSVGAWQYGSGAFAAAAVWLRVGVVLFTLTFLACRYAVHCYKTQTSIGARFAVDPDEQYWVDSIA